MKGLLRYDVGLSVALLALTVALWTHHFLLLAWASSAPLVLLLQHIWRNTDPALRFGACWMIFTSGIGYVVFLHTAAQGNLGLACLVGALVLMCFESACLSVNHEEQSR